MMRSLFSGVAGLKTHQTKMENVQEGEGVIRKNNIF